MAMMEPFSAGGEQAGRSASTWASASLANRTPSGSGPLSHQRHLALTFNATCSKRFATGQRLRGSICTGPLTD